MSRVAPGFLANIAVGSATEGFPQILQLLGGARFGFPQLFLKTEKAEIVSDFPKITLQDPFLVSTFSLSMRHECGHTLTIFPIAVLCKSAFLYPYATRRVAGLSNICVRIIAEVSLGTYGINKLQKTHKQKSAAAVSNG